MSVWKEKFNFYIIVLFITHLTFNYSHPEILTFETDSEHTEKT